MMIWIVELSVFQWFVEHCNWSLFLYFQWHPIIYTFSVVPIDNRKKTYSSSCHFKTQFSFWCSNIAIIFRHFLSHMIFVHFMHQLFSDVTFSYMPFWDFRMIWHKRLSLKNRTSNKYKTAPIMHKYTNH